MRSAVNALLQYAIDTGLIENEDRVYACNRLLEVFSLDELPAKDTPLAADAGLETILDALCDAAVARGLIDDNITARDLFDTKLMGALTPWPREVQAHFRALYAESSELATDWYYRFSQDTNYIRRDRIKKDLKWVYNGQYGPLDITINLSKPEKDPRAIAAARLAPQSGYPACLLCVENEGYAGRMNHPARQNHRLIPLTLGRPELEHAVLPLCLLQRALHRAVQRAPADEGRYRLLPPPAGLCGPVPALLPRLERRPADRRRLDPQPRPLPGRPL